MKHAMTLILCLLFVLPGAGPSMAADQDIKGSKDHPLLSRMPGFHIGGYKDKDFDSHQFIGKDGKKVAVEGRMYYLEYNLDKGAAQPGELKIRRNIEEALKKIGGKVVFDDNFNRVSTIVLERGSRVAVLGCRDTGPLH